MHIDGALNVSNNISAHFDLSATVDFIITFVLCYFSSIFSYFYHSNCFSRCFYLNFSAYIIFILFYFLGLGDRLFAELSEKIEMASSTDTQF